MKTSIIKVYVEISAEDESQTERDMNLLESRLRPFAHYFSNAVVTNTLDEIEAIEENK